MTVVQSPLTLEIKQRLRSGEKPVTLSKIYGKDVYRIMREMLVERNPVSPTQDDSIDPNTPVTEITEDDLEVIDPNDVQPSLVKKQVPGQPPRFTQVKRGTPLKRTVQAVEVNMADESLDKVRGIYSMIMVPRVLSMPMPDLLYKAMIISIVEFGWTEMKPNDFIDTVLSQWLEACGIITPGYIRQDDIDNAATLKDDEALQAISDYVKTNNLMSEQEFLVKYKVKADQPGNGNGGNGHNGNGHKEPDAAVHPLPQSRIEPILPTQSTTAVDEKPLVVEVKPEVKHVDPTVITNQIEALKSPEIKPAQTVQDLFKSIMEKDGKN